jgi:hypothetical protein
MAYRETGIAAELTPIGNAGASGWGEGAEQAERLRPRPTAKPD